MLKLGIIYILNLGTLGAEVQLSIVEEHHYVYSLARATPQIEDREGLVTPIYAFGVFPHDSWGRFNSVLLAIGTVKGL